MSSIIIYKPGTTGTIEAVLWDGEAVNELAGNLCKYYKSRLQVLEGLLTETQQKTYQDWLQNHPEDKLMK